MGVTEGKPTDVPLLRRGNHLTPAAAVARRFPVVLAGEKQPALPKDQSGRPSVVIRFINAVHGVAPQANGPAYFVQEAGKVVWTSFSAAFAYAFIGVTVILFIALVIGLWGVKILRDKRRLDEERKKRLGKSRSQKL